MRNVFPGKNGKKRSSFTWVLWVEKLGANEKMLIAILGIIKAN